MSIHLYICVHSSITHSSQRVDITRVFIHRQMGKQTVAYPGNGILFSLEQECSSDVRHNVDGP